MQSDLPEQTDHTASDAPAASPGAVELPRTEPKTGQSRVELKGYVDFYGYHTLAGGWCFAGWVTRQGDVLQNLGAVTVRFTRGALELDAMSLIFPRNDISGEDAVGFCVFLPAPPSTPGELVSVGLYAAGAVHPLAPVQGAHQELDKDLAARIDFILTTAERGPRRTAMDLRLNGRKEQAGTGFIEYFGYHQAAGGWFFSGWVSRAWDEGAAPTRALISFDEGDARVNILTSLYRRADLPDEAGGVVFFVPGKAAGKGALKAVSLRAGEATFTLSPVGHVAQLRELELTNRVKGNLASAPPGLSRDRLTNSLANRSYTGEDTLDQLSPSIYFCADHSYLCGANGLLLMGWMLVKPDEISEVNVRCGDKSVALAREDLVKISRLDVLEQFEAQGFDDANCGYIAYVPDIVQGGERIYLEVKTNRFEVGYRNIAAPQKAGMAAIKQVLGAVDLRFDDLMPALDAVLGPAVEEMNKARLSARVGRQVVEYGARPGTPKYSVIIPLYGRLEFVEYQMGLFSAHPGAKDVEFVFVLDDPPKKREAQYLFASVYERFKLPFRAVLLEKNLGFAPANNVGLEYCHGEYLCYLNSDVFPGTPDWLERLSVRLEENPQLGCVGPLLLFEDGAIQHHAMYYERVPEFGNMYFSMHADKGLRYNGPPDLVPALAITGACMVLRRDLAERLGGFDEVFAIGDFEDCDLCLKLASWGYGCAVDHGVVLYHLERKSQISGALTWRANLTAYNAWQHERRWAKTIDEKQAHEFRVPA